ncbi:MAG: LacI family DNA-binding transcriptional regulator [Anaerolineae bacterium]|nr:LacI family DNA-binding transcriptional regulator [Anaerolineae bacterium]
MSIHNLEDIARLAGVSKSTVSRVVNNHPNVSARTRTRVMRVITEQQFRPNSAARALVTQQTRVLSVVIPQPYGEAFNDPFFLIILQSIARAAAEADYAIMLWIGGVEHQEERFGERILNNAFFDGILIMSADDKDPILQNLSRAGYPFVQIGPPQFDGANYVDVNNRRGAYEAAKHLASLGHRRIGVIAGPLNKGEARARLIGCLDGLAESAVSPLPEWISEGNFDEPSGYRAMKHLLRHDLQAVFVSNDTMALGALRALDEAGIGVPGQIALAGFDDMPFSVTTRPPLTTVRQPIEEMGEAAVRMLIALVEGAPTEPRQVILPTRLVIRESCGASRMTRGGS